MNSWRVLSIIIVVVFFSKIVIAQGVVETFKFENDELTLRYQKFVAELRCPKCQNQNLAGSNSPIAKDLRGELYRLLHEGSSDQEIVAFMVDRYGEFVLYRPRLNWHTAVLWCAPIVLLMVGAFIVVRMTKSRKLLSDANSTNTSLDQKQKDKLDALLNPED